MGKKKSTVLMVLLTILMAVLCAITVFPTTPIPGTVFIWNPAVMQYDFGSDLGGGYYTYYYPTGVISETEYKELEAEDQEDYVQHGGLYINTDPMYGIVDDSEPDEDNNGFVDAFEEQFKSAVAVISERYAKKGYSDFRVAVVDDFALRVQIPASEKTDLTSAFDNACATFGLFSNTGEMTITLTDSVVSELNEYEISEIINEFSVHTQYNVAYLKVTFSSVGEEIVNRFLEEVYAANIETESSSSSQAEDVTLKIMLGDEAFVTLDQSSVDNGLFYNEREVRVPMKSIDDIDYVETLVVLLNSAMYNAEGFDFTFESIATSEVRTFGTILGVDTLFLLYIALAVVILVAIVYAVVRMGKFGVASAYSTVAYLIVTGICFAFITGGVYEITLGTALMFALGLMLVTVMDTFSYKAIKEELALGKTVFSAVKNGYKNSIMFTVDVYAVLLLGAIALLIGVPALQTFATQAMICIITGAFCNLLGTRCVSYMLLSASKDKYKYFRVVREDNDDE